MALEIRVLEMPRGNYLHDGVHEDQSFLRFRLLIPRVTRLHEGAKNRQSFWRLHCLGIAVYMMERRRVKASGAVGRCCMFGSSNRMTSWPKVRDMWDSPTAL